MVRKIINKIKKECTLFLDYQKIKKELKQKNKIVYIGSPLHGNIGDHAISIATMNLLSKLKNPVVEIPGVIYSSHVKKIKSMILKNDIICITGGGLIGNLWMQEEEMVKSVIETFSDNKLIILPETFYFESTIEAKKELESFKSCIDQHPNVYIMTREKASYLFCKEKFKHVKKVYLLPDLVLTLNYSSNKIRDGVLFVNRKDKEKTSNLVEFQKEIPNSKCIDTVLPYSIMMKDRNREFEKILQQFSSASLVVTDRLHAMIFAAITGTPCIALDNKNKKVSGVYQWIKDLEYIEFCDDEKQLFAKIQRKIDCTTNFQYTLNQMYQEKIFEILLQIIKK